jgi:hypothetical protein
MGADGIQLTAEGLVDLQRLQVELLGGGEVARLQIRFGGFAQVYGALAEVFVVDGGA